MCVCMCEREREGKRSCVQQYVFSSSSECGQADGNAYNAGVQIPSERRIYVLLAIILL